MQNNWIKKTQQISFRCKNVNILYTIKNTLTNNTLRVKHGQTLIKNVSKNKISREFTRIIFHWILGTKLLQCWL
jgi:hypothetical protein